MFCSSCGTPNEDGATACRVCGESLVRPPHWKKWIAAVGTWTRKKATWLLVGECALLAAVGLAIYFYRASQEFEITGELLYKNENRMVRPVGGARIEVFENKKRGSSRPSKYLLLLKRQFYLNLPPEYYDPKADAQLAPLQGVLFPPLSKVQLDWSYWESQRVGNCGSAQRFFEEDQGGPSVIVTTTYTNTGGLFWLKLKRGKYFITAQGDVPSFFRLKDDLTHQPDTSTPLNGDAFWSVPVTVRGTMKVVSAEPICSPL